VKLRKEAIAKMAHHSTSIEGNPLTLEQVTNLLAGKEIAAWEKDKREIVNYFQPPPKNKVPTSNTRRKHKRDASLSSGRTI
jgi:Fic family protein